VDWLNYHHLLYFWVVAREGSIARAGQELRLAPSTISAQIGRLEGALGEKLFARVGRRLVLTDAGRLVAGYADQIFGLGRELVAAVRAAPAAPATTLVVGVSDALPKLIAYRLLEPALRLKTPVRVVCREDRPERLLAELAMHAVDIVLANVPAGPTIKVRAFNHLLGESGMSFFAAPRLAAAHGRRFPRSLDGSPVLLPRETTPVRAALERWFEDVGVRPRIVGEFDDSALLKAFGQSGAGVFPVASAIEAEVCRQYGVRAIGRVEEVRERFYAITLERRLTHPAVVAIREAARGTLSE
jgi:LysR family transcriptional activator of nhaA